MKLPLKILSKLIVSSQVVCVSNKYSEYKIAKTKFVITC